MSQVSQSKVQQQLLRAARQQAGVNRLLQWWDITQKFHLEPRETEPPHDWPSLSDYGRFIAMWCLTGLAQNTQQAGTIPPDEESFFQLLKENLIVYIYMAELEFNPWGVATAHQINRLYPKNGYSLQSCRLPNFLLPTGCLYCGEPLGFTAYADTSIRKTKHKECASKWDKSIRLLHIQALEKHTQLFTPSGDKQILFERLQSSYGELAHLYPQAYKPRYTLIDAYKDIPNETWIQPLSSLQPRHDLLKLPFIQKDIQNYELIIAVNAEGEWEEDYREKPEKRAVTLSELDHYFISS